MMMNLFNYMIFFLISCMMFSFFYKHILLTLISMEFIMINIFFSMYFIINKMNLNLFFPSLFISISICEGIMGLSILVYMMRNSGNDYLNSLNLMKW